MREINNPSLGERMKIGKKRLERVRRWCRVDRGRVLSRVVRVRRVGRRCRMRLGIVG